MTHATSMPDGQGIGIDRHPVATIVLGPDNSIDAVNAAAQDLLGMSERSLRGKQVADILPVFAGRNFMPSGSMRAFDVAVGGISALQAVNVLAETGEDKVTFLALSTSNRASPSRAASQQPSSGSTAAILAHEIKNPLSGIRGAAQLLAQGTKEPEKFTGLICREVDRIAALIDRMEILSAERSLDLEAASIFPTVRHALDLARAGFAADVDIEEAHDPSLPEARFHKDSLVQIVLNLVKNASEAVAGRPEGFVRVSTSFRHGYTIDDGVSETRCEAPIMLAVTDNGDGVAERILPDLFRPFASARTGGTGLGLALVDRLARDMGGNVEYDRDDEHGLTHFRLMLGRADKP